MRDVPGYTPGSIRTFEPRTGPGVRVTIRAPSFGELRMMGVDVEAELARHGFGVPVPDQPGESTPVPAIAWIEASRTCTLRRFVLGVEAYRVAGQAVTTGAELADHGEFALVREVANEISGAGSLSESQKKPSDSTPT